MPSLYSKKIYVFSHMVDFNLNPVILLERELQGKFCKYYCRTSPPPPDFFFFLTTLCLCIDSMFAERAIFEYRLSLADQIKQTSFFCFCLQQTNGSLLFPFSVYSIEQKPFYVSSIFQVYIYIYKFIYIRKQKPRWFPWIRLPLAHHAYGSW